MPIVLLFFKLLHRASLLFSAVRDGTRVFYAQSAISLDHKIVIIWCVVHMVELFVIRVIINWCIKQWMLRSFQTKSICPVAVQIQTRRFTCTHLRQTDNIQIYIFEILIKRPLNIPNPKTENQLGSLHTVGDSYTCNFVVQKLTTNNNFHVISIKIVSVDGCVELMANWCLCHE